MPSYTEAILAEVREYLKQMNTDDIISQILDQSSDLYKFCKRANDSLPRYLDAVAHILMEKGDACGRSCKPGLIFVEKPKTEPTHAGDGK